MKHNDNVSKELVDIISEYKVILEDNAWILDAIFNSAESNVRLNKLITRIKERALSLGESDFSSIAIRSLFYNSIVQATKVPHGFTLPKDERDSLTKKINNATSDLKECTKLLSDDWKGLVANGDGDVLYINKIALEVFFDLVKDDLNHAILGDIKTIRATVNKEVKYFCKYMHDVFFDMFEENLWADISFLASVIYKRNVSIDNVRDYCRVSR